MKVREAKREIHKNPTTEKLKNLDGIFELIKPLAREEGIREFPVKTYQDKAKLIQAAMFVAETKKQVATPKSITNREAIAPK